MIYRSCQYVRDPDVLDGLDGRDDDHGDGEHGGDGDAADVLCVCRLYAKNCRCAKESKKKY